MKATFLFIISLCFITMLQAQVSKTVEITPGNLSSLLTEEEKATITDLTLTGSMNATDFGTMKHQMPLLTSLDLSAVSIVSYKETNPSCRFDVTYPENTLPGITPYCPNYTLQPLTSLILPNTLTAIGWYALGGSAFSTIVIPPLVTTIEDEAFKGCEALTTITIPSSVTELGLGIFSDCISLTSIDLSPTIRTIEDNTFSNCTALNSIDIPSSVTSIGGNAFYGCSSLSEISLPPSLIRIGYEAFNGCSALISVVIPSSVTDIDGFAFANCTNLRTVSIPPLVEEIIPSVFNNCTSLSAIYLYRPTPPRIGLDDPLHGVDRSTCTLYVPYGSADLYASALVWQDFTHIVEMHEFSLSATSVIMEKGQGSTEVQITSDNSWTASSDQSWLSLNPSSGSGNQTITLTSDANSMDRGRTALVTVTGDTLSQVITVFQKGVPRTIDMTAGTLSAALTADALLETTELILTGEIDARDFKTMRDEMPNLAVLDLSGATIVVYKGNEGTIEDLNTTYPPNRIPPEAFYNKSTDLKPRLTSVQLPLVTESIGYNAFNSCYLLTDIKIFDSMAIIDEGAFKNCSNLTFVDLFSVNTLGKNAFYGCQRLTSMRFPSSLTNFGEGAFLGCSALYSIYSYSSEASYLNDFNNVFKGIDQKTCTLYVAPGSKASYEAADQWKDFENIVEMTELNISPKEITLEPTLGSSATITISGKGLWTLGWDQSWLDLDKVYGIDDLTVTVTIDEANTTAEDRICIVTIDPIGLDRQIVVVTQKGIATGVAEIAQNRPSFICYPNPFTNEIAIEIQNPEKEKMTVDIYNLAGQMVKNLTMGNTSEKLSLSWDGCNEQGQQVVPGVFICRMNGQTMQVVKGR